MEQNTTSDRYYFGESVKIIIPINEGEYPVVVKSNGNTNYSDWAITYKDELNKLLLTHGAVLLRGFKLGGATAFNELFTELFGSPMEYKNRTSPREKVHDNVYTSTSHPNDQLIYMHTENSYAKVFNRIIAFYCLIPSLHGGETPIAEERKLANYLGEDILNKFRKLKIQYVRNIFNDVGLTWNTIYQTDDKKVLNDILEKQGMDYTWVTPNQLRIKWVMPALQIHPVTKQELWFNHMYFGHKSLCDPIVLEFFKECDLPFSTYYGDGTQIEESVLKKITDFYTKNSMVFKWEQDDVLLLDNMMFAHGRNPFKGERKILTAMGEINTSND